MKEARPILILTQWSFSDPLIQAYTLPYVRIMRRLRPDRLIFLVTFEQRANTLPPAEMNKAASGLHREGIQLLSYNYSSNVFINLIKWSGLVFRLLILIARKNIEFIHAWCTPAGSMGYALSVLSGRKLVIDSFEPHAEAMVENGSWARGGIKFRLLFMFEKWQARRAFALIGTTEAMKDYARKKYGAAVSRFYVKPACVNESRFHPGKRKNAELTTKYGLKDKIVCVYAGKFGGIYLAREVFDFFRVAREVMGEKFSVLLLTPSDPELLRHWATESGFEAERMIVRYVPHDDVPDYMGLADFAITPVRPAPAKRYCTPIKDGEYWAMGIPVVITRDISDDSEIIERHSAGAVIHELNEKSYRRAILRIRDILEEPAGQAEERIRKLAGTYRGFSIAENVYARLYGNIDPA